MDADATRLPPPVAEAGSVTCASSNGHIGAAAAAVAARHQSAK